MEDDREDVKETLVEELRRIHDGLGVPPRTVDVGKHGRFSPALYAERFGSWEEALEAAGIEGTPERPPDDATVSEREDDSDESDDETEDEDGGDSRDLDEFETAVVRAADRVKGAPTPEDLRERGYSVNEAVEEHGSWKAFLQSIGVETEYVEGSRNERRAPKDSERLLGEVKRYASLHGEPPTEDDVAATDWMSAPSDYRRVFGGVNEAVAETDDVEEGGDGSDGRDELLSEVKRFYLRRGRPPTEEDVTEEDWMSSKGRYDEVFGGVDRAVEESGVDGCT